VTGTSATTSTVTLGWSPSTDNVQVEGYQVFRNGTLVGDVTGTAFTDKGLLDATPYRYTVKAYDTGNNPSTASDPKVVYTADGTAPTAPGTPIPTKEGAGVVSLRWTAATDNSGVIAKYTISRTTNGGTPLLLGSTATTTFVDKSVPAGANSWTVIAYDAAGNPSRSRTTTSPITSAAVVAPLQASSVQVLGATGVRLLRYGGKSGSRMLLTFNLKATVVPAQLNLRVLSGNAKVKVSLPLGKGRTTPGKRINELRAKKGTLTIPLGKMPRGKLRLIVTASQGKMVTLSAPKKATKPTLSQR